MGLFGERRPFLEKLTHTDCLALRALGSRRSFEPQEHLVTEGGQGTDVLLILSGWCAIRRSTERGPIILALRTAGELVGEMAALDGRPRSATVSALGPVEALAIAGDRFRHFMAARPYVTGLVMAQLTERLRSADDERRALASGTVLERLATCLVQLCDRTGPAPDGSVAISPPLSQSEIAAAVGATREAVAKALRLLREQGLVTTGPKTVVVADVDLLRLLGSGAA
ncbi:cAMP-binding domain of CRP or a regulatory subunit of cAMP-dependent protein kinases [Actinacidiphila alni]|uniref:cAMP-binding domain of CRP or a regulatory subunit of cAMP-dependent protein kinases n=1 Tax=Actinacidiphila alni TaxID=380248 RepID=A0A1I2D7H1_9ACTN|nr:Crp/Fnr family transcriptional regulator [Actinacidiphila alni]SFE76454.1 cAMP-binding domain of CRP or a regulatory subunit of cAMP-dependent protein kinases [Actinacidiphila alni]